MKKAFRLISFLEGVSYLLLLFIAVPIKYFQGNELYVKILGMPHGILFIGYILLLILIQKKNEMEFKNYVSHITSFYNSFRHFLCRYKVFTKLLKKEVFTKEGGTTQ
jgi:integral membrane protein